MRSTPAFIFTFAMFAGSMVLGLLAARLLTGWAIAAALRWGVLSPVTDRSSHSQPTPRLGGLGLAGGFALASALFLGALWLIPHRHAMLGYNPGLVGWIALGWLAMLATGLLDDLFDLPPLVKLALMTGAALLPVLGGRIDLDLIHSIMMPMRLQNLVEIVAVVLWILFFTNAFNFMDGMDGLAANFARTAATTMFFTLLVSAFRFNNIEILRAEAYLLPILAMACWGFLHWNAPPARIFMGDAGSLSIGYLLAVWMLMGSSYRFGLYLPGITSVTILMPFLFDVILTLVRRARRGENLLRAHRQHLYQRLLATGLTHAEVLRLNRTLFLGCGLLGLAGANFLGPMGQLGGLLGAVGLMTLYWFWTLRREGVAG